MATRKWHFTPLTKNISAELEKRSSAAWSSIPFKKLVIVIFLVNFLTSGSVFFIQKNLPPEIPLYFGLPQGAAQLSSSMGLIIPAAISLSITIINTTLTLFVFDDYLKKALILASLGLTFFSTIAVYKITQLVGSF